MVVGNLGHSSVTEAQSRCLEGTTSNASLAISVRANVQVANNPSWRNCHRTRAYTLYFTECTRE